MHLIFHMQSLNAFFLNFFLKNKGSLKRPFIFSLTIITVDQLP